MSNIGWRLTDHDTMVNLNHVSKIEIVFDPSEGQMAWIDYSGASGQELGTEMFQSLDAAKKVFKQLESLLCK